VQKAHPSWKYKTVVARKGDKKEGDLAAKAHPSPKARSWRSIEFETS
jgi:hypothetical protein